MTQAYRLGIKLFAAEPESIRVRDFVPVFHSWIQTQCVDGHLLVDVHDYSHIHHGPGILLVAHEGNFSTDMNDGRLGLLYFRKQPVSGDLDSRLAAALKTAVQAASLLEGEARFEGRLRFLRNEALVIANDRLLAPNDTATFEEVKPALRKVFGEDAKFSLGNSNPRERLAISVRGTLRIVIDRLQSGISPEARPARSDIL